MRDEDWETPEDIRDLWRAEYLLVCALRAMAFGHGDCPAVRQAFVGACGEAADQTLMSYFVVVQYVGMTSRRRLALHAPGCIRLSSDERSMIALVAAAQESLRLGVDAGLRIALSDLVEGEPREGLVQAVLMVARSLQDNGHRLPLRLSALAPPPGAAEASPSKAWTTLH